ncbi:hypothetical protein [Archangium sp. Cb G35]|nr:hypothetical protein [Archangium sp. Cb G35]
MKKTPKKKTPSRNLRPVVMLIVAVLAGGMVVRFDWNNLRFELQVGRIA